VVAAVDVHLHPHRIVHLACNLLALWQVGELVERLVGNSGFLLLYTFSGILGSLASYYSNPHIVSAGASGAIFGVYGALLGCLFQNPGVFPPRSSNASRAAPWYSWATTSSSACR